MFLKLIHNPTLRVNTQRTNKLGLTWHIICSVINQKRAKLRILKKLICVS